MDQPRRIIVNQALARKYFPGRDPLGRHVWLENQRDPYEIVGVAGDAKYSDVRAPAPPIVYQFALMSRGSSDLSLRTSGRPGGPRGRRAPPRQRRIWFRIPSDE
jgi:hypothetical protein